MKRRHVLSFVVSFAIASPTRGRECGQAQLDAKDISGCVSLTHMKYIGHGGAVWLAEALHNNSDLELLDLHHARVGDTDALALADGLRNNRALLRLALHNNKIGDTGAAAIGTALAENTALEFLSLSSNAVSDRGVVGIAQGLRNNTVLRRLDLYFNLVSDAGVSALAEALSPKSGLRMLHLDSNTVGDAGAKSLANALDRGAPLGELTLTYNRLRNNGAKQLLAAARASKALHAMALSHNQMLHGEDAVQVAQLNDELKPRKELAGWLVSAGLAEWMGSTGPPLLSPFAAPVSKLEAHTRSGLLALRHMKAGQLTAHPALATLGAEDRKRLGETLLREVGAAAAASHDEL